MPRLRHFVIGAVTALSLALPVAAQNTIFGSGWLLDSDASSLQFQSIKNGSTIETSSFASLAGAISPDGSATIKVALDSVDTKVDLRNVRMRFLFFETFQFPEASVSTRIDPALISDLAELRRKTITLPFTLDLHGVTKTLDAQLSLTLIGDDLVAVSTAEPINLAVADFNLDEGLLKLEEAAGVTIVPSSSVSFDFIFRGTGDSTPQVATATTDPATVPTQVASTALETAGNFSLSECVGRFEILSRSDSIYFNPGSATLQPKSFALLDEVQDIVSRCPGMNIQIAGHTDSIGKASYNQRLSEQRAASVVKYLTSNGISADRMDAIGFGEERPIADNATERGRWRNRRIEFSVPKT